MKTAVCGILMIEKEIHLKYAFEMNIHRWRKILHSQILLKMGFFGRNKEPSFLDDIGDSLRLSKKTRMRGFIICFSIGLLCTMGSLFLLPMAVISSTFFALVYSVGHLMSISATFFLFGPSKQLKKMFKPKRAIASISYIGSVFLVLFLALKDTPMPVLIFLVIVSFCCLLYYVASYIPFAQRCLRSTASSVISV
ncbi:hypothetical protein P9112_005341 [Eukaryota sp. TZLM1-RC]